MDNCLGVLQFAQQFSCPRLVHYAKDFICEHFKHRSDLFYYILYLPALTLHYVTLDLVYKAKVLFIYKFIGKACEFPCITCEKVSFHIFLVQERQLKGTEHKGNKVFARHCPNNRNRITMFSIYRVFYWQTYRQIVRTDEFRSLNEGRVKELLSQDGLSVKSEVDILTALVVWLNANLSSTPDVEWVGLQCV